METKKSHIRHSIIYGLCIGGAMILYQLILFVFCMTNNMALNNITFVIYLVGIFISVKHFRDLNNEGSITFPLAFKTTVWTVIFIVLPLTVYSYFQFKYLQPGLIDEFVILLKEKLLSRNLSKEEQEAYLILAANPTFMAFEYALGMCIWGTLFSLLISMFVKRDLTPLRHNE